MAWSSKYKKSIDCNNPKGFSQKAHCAGRTARQKRQKTKSKSVNERTMKITEHEKNRLIEVIAKKHKVSESFVGHLFKYINSRKLAKDPEIRKMAKDLDKVTQDVRDTFDKKIKSGELKDTPELRKLRKTYGL